MFDKYRHLVNSLQTNCVCIENNELKTQFNELDVKYLRLKSKKITITSADQIVDNHNKDDNNSNTRDKWYKNNINNTETLDTSAVSVVNEAIKTGRGRPKKSMVLSLTTKRNKLLKSNQLKSVYSCDYIGCDKQFRYMSLLKTHIQIKHNTAERLFKCDIDGCDQRFNRKEYIKRHKTNVHNNDRPYGCEWPGCGLRFKDNTRLKLHNKRHSGGCDVNKSSDVRKCHKLNPITTEESLAKKKIMHKIYNKNRGKKYCCNWDGCGKWFRDNYNLVKHRRAKHTGERPFKCQLCDKTFVIENYVKVHQLAVHTNNNNSDGQLDTHKCPYNGCAKEYKSVKSLNIHISQRHILLATKRFRCDVDGCDKGFYYKNRMELHKQRVHYDLRPYPCEWPGCDKRFKSSNELRVHRERHSGVRQYRCDVGDCNKSYTTHKCLQQHKRSHTRPYQCSWPACEFRCGSSVTLEYHMNGHQGIKPFKCHFHGCDCSYSSRASLRVHCLQTNCVCIENNELKTQFNELDVQYLTLKTMKITTISADQIVDNHNNDDNNSNTRDQCYNNNIINKESVDISVVNEMNRPIKRGRGRPKKSMVLSLTTKQNKLLKKSNHLKSVYSCDYTGCDKQFRYMSLLKTHIQIKHNTAEGLFKCDINGCDQRFYRKEYIKRHKTNVHNDDRPYGCEWPGCGLRFKDNSRLKLHNKRHTAGCGANKSSDDRNCHKLNPITSEESVAKMKIYKQIYNKNRVKKYCCNWEGCGKRIRDKDMLLAHIRVKHTGERPFKCQICDKTFPMDKHLKSHHLTVHTNNSDGQLATHKCPYDGCAKEYKSVKSLDIHISQRHTLLATKRFRCDVDGCDKCFYDKNQMKKHKQRVHYDLRPYPCEWPGCDKRFKSPTELKIHRERHSGVRQYRCDVGDCNKTYATRKCLQQHKRSHTRPYQCSWPSCEFRCANNINLEDHMNGHQGIKPFKCHFHGCDCSYSSRASLRVHWIEMMANVVIKDVFEELTEENRRLLSELRYCQQMLEMFVKYRHLMNNFQTNCFCIENNTNKIKYNKLEDQYMILMNDNKCDDNSCYNNQNNGNKSNDNYTETVVTLVDSLMNNKSIETTTRRTKILPKKMVYKCHYMGCDKQFGYNSLLQSHIRIKHCMDDKQDIKVIDINENNNNIRIRPDGQTLDEDIVIVNESTNKRLPIPVRRKRVRSKNYWCDWIGCDKRFCYSYLLLAHIRTKHTDERPIKCDECDKTFPTDFCQRVHKKKCHRNLKFKCRYNGCDKEYKSRASLDDHHLRHEGLLQKTFRCDVDGCDKCFYTNYLLQTHKRTIHSVDRPNQCDTSVDLRIKHDGQTLDEDIMTVNDSKESVVKMKRIHKPDRRRRVRSKNYLCDWMGCDKRFCYSYELLAHTRTKHTGERPLKCQMCDKRFATERCVKKHQSNVHSIKTSKNNDNNSDGQQLPPTHKCPYDGCTKEYQLVQSLGSHIRQVHKKSSTKSFRCDADGCDKYFYNKILMESHKQRIHYDVRPYPCEWPGCDKQFKSTGELKIHRQRHSGVRQYRCDYGECNKSFTTQKGLLQHKNGHTLPYLCSWPACEFRCASNVVLSDHLNGHQGIKPFKCHFHGCDCSYSSRSSLRAHWRQTHKFIKSFDFLNLLIKDVLDELNEENQRLFDELRYCQQLMEMFDKYRHLVNSLQTNCVCIENNELKTQFNEMDVKYIELKTRYTTDHRMNVQKLSDDKSSDQLIDRPRIKRQYIKRKIKTTSDTLVKSQIRKKYNKQKNLKTINQKIDDNCCDDRVGDKITDKPINDNDCDIVVNKTSSSSSSSSSPVMKYRCHWEGCGKCLYDRQKLVAHIRVKHTGERPYRCDKCDKTYPMKGNLTVHQKELSTTKQHNCPYDGCTKVYCFRTSLIEHIKRYHKNPLNTTVINNKFKCDVDGCDKSFYYKSVFENHKKFVHLDVRPFPCEWPGCDKRFKSTTDLKAHRERHTGVRQYRCDVGGDDCTKSYTTYKGLAQHKRSHTRPYQCSWPACQFKCISNATLNDHLRRHQGIKPFKCHFHGCDCSYSSRASLRAHWQAKQLYGNKQRMPYRYLLQRFLCVKYKSL
ncbi:uncharacterized protein LOC128964968 [Oppia nitens]|uniref:uncharacterized protein LOC128964968 n=1 Tax=Oppia nitens TaxID=1686743 RepID=UPI0023DB9188|nr:uncharacterized protein LOC128964968 [Oppia nitens]